MDAAAAVTWAGTQEWSYGKVGTWGKSYDAWTQVMALARTRRTWRPPSSSRPSSSGYGIAYVNGVHHDCGWYATTALYQGYDYTPNSVNGQDATPRRAAGFNPPRATARHDPTCWPSSTR